MIIQTKTTVAFRACSYGCICILSNVHKKNNRKVKPTSSVDVDPLLVTLETIQLNMVPTLPMNNEDHLQLVLGLHCWICVEPLGPPPRLGGATKQGVTKAARADAASTAGNKRSWRRPNGWTRGVQRLHALMV